MQNFVGLLLPPVIDLVNTKIPNSNVRFLASMLISALVAVVLSPQLLTDIVAGYQTGSVETLLKEVTLVWAEAQLVYKLYWENSAPRESLQKTLK